VSEAESMMNLSTHSSKQRISYTPRLICTCRFAHRANTSATANDAVVRTLAFPMPGDFSRSTARN